MLFASWKRTPAITELLCIYFSNLFHIQNESYSMHFFEIIFSKHGIQKHSPKKSNNPPSILLVKMNLF